MTSGTAPRQYGFVMEQVLGHVTHYQTLRRSLDTCDDVAARWVEVTYRGESFFDRLRPVPAGVRGTLRGFQQVRAGLRGRSLDALYFHTQKPAVFNWDLLARIPTVLSLDVTPRQYDELGAFYDHAPDGDNPIAALKHWMNRRTFALASKVVVWSSWVTGSLVQDYGVPEDKIQVIPPGVDLTQWIDPGITRPADALPRILFVGGDFSRKGGDLLLDWFRQAGRGRCELDLVTRTPLAPEPGVSVYGNVQPNSELAKRLFFGADLFTMPSLGECFGIAQTEAMAAGLPVVATRVGGSPDIVGHGETGFLVEPNDGRGLGAALDALLADATLRRGMGARGRVKAEQLFDAETNAHAVLRCMENAAATKSTNESVRADVAGMSATQLHLNGEKTGVLPRSEKLRPW
jgi:glycosyltransferase involved in cell wall biosynthesis